MPEFVHLHSHTQFSLLDGASNIDVLMEKAAADNMKAVALTDHGNMFGAFKFVAAAEKHGIKPIVGCEFYLVENRHKQSFAKAKGERDKRYHQLMLAKNQIGYQNLCKLCSYGFMEGLYSKFPRIDKELIEKHHEGLIVTSCCVGAEIPQAIIEGNIEKAEELLKWWLNIFGEDYYIEIQRHRGLEDLDIFKDGKRTFSGVSQEDVNQVLLGFAKKYNVKVIATNDAHYVEEEDWQAHDMLLCINTGSLVEDTNRFKFSSSDFYFKSQAEMNAIFTDVPDSIANTMEIYDKVDKLTLARDILLPAFPLPQQFKTQDDFLRHLTYEGAKRRYGIITPEIAERLDFELDVIRNSGYPGYFLIVQDFTTEARNMGVSVGPGRGSAAGSAVAYCLGITNIDPIKYDLLFERFLNPERVSMPDIDIDFDDVGRSKVMDYVIEKYGRNQVAQIITYGSMAAKSSLQDVGRVMNIPLSDVINVKKQFPDDLGATLKKVLADGDVHPKLKGKLNSEELEKAYQFRNLAQEDNEIGTMIRNAHKLEGSIRNTGIHACGVVITPDDITNFVPVTVAKDSDLLVSQFDNSVAEDAGLLKMDFLGLKTLTIIKDACKIIKAKHGVEIEPDEIPLDDKKTYELFQRGETIGVFQYESPGMQKYMRELTPTEFSDLIAMNALYRPGPIAYIPLFIDRKHGREPIQYDLDDMKEYLEETYGITVYQEQVMLLSQKLAGFTKGEADMLRKAMGKKKKKLIDQMFPKFEEGCAKNGHTGDVVKKIWKDWEAFASYAFNKSHSTCYAFVAFQTAYLKAHYPAEFMASVLTHNKSDISKVNFFLQECKNQNVEVLGPDINESYMNFSVNKEGKVRFGLSALKGVGEGPVEEILNTKKESGEPYKDIFDVVRRINLRVANKKCFESLAYGGAFDAFGLDRALYFTKMDGKHTFLELVLRYGNAYQKQKSEMAFSLFGADAVDETMPTPKLPENVTEWNLMEKLKKEKEVTGIYLSGHPLDDYRLEISKFTKTINRLDEFKDQEVAIAGIITSVNHRVSQKGSLFGFVGIEDYEGTNFEFGLFGDNYLKHRHLLETDTVIYIKGKYQKSWRDPNQFELRINEIQLLDEVGSSKIKGIAINLPIQLLTPQLIDQLDMICDKHKGEQQFSVNLLDAANKIILQLDSSNRRINADSLFITEIEKLDLSYKMLS
ncbi:DNA polymerase III subunit alpha [Aureispira anguillae]|uniref:DNA polymerase III subunit alpha n=1 Tax=Aureispira anguillae TaxID=2864201 RepID=A0A915YE91_9BACT|nr:DNA polymerase III subunit alpha [Aureispira anguillae]BDS11401.1 DNA polymerase III subunit alpha [Aureispira anguillae]